MAKTIAEINEKIARKEVVVLTAEEMKQLVKTKGAKEAAQTVDVVTTATFGPMCSSGVYLNLGHTKPKIKIGGGKATLNDIPAYAGFAAVDIYLGAAALPDDDPRNHIFPGKFKYGGAHVIEELAGGKSVLLKASGYGTDCYPRKQIETLVSLKDVNEAVLFNMRNAYQNYNIAVNLSDKTLYTYMGVLKPKLGNAYYCSAGQISPLLNDPYYKTIGIGTRIFIGGAIGYIVWWGTQHNPSVKRADNGTPLAPAGTVAIIGDLKQMNAQWLRGVSMLGYGTSLAVGIGVPIPILNEEMALYTSVTDDAISTNIVDYSTAYPQGTGDVLGRATYAQCRSGSIKIADTEVPTGSLSSCAKALEICHVLKEWIQKGKFQLAEPVAPLPSFDSGYTAKPLKIREPSGKKAGS